LTAARRAQRALAAGDEVWLPSEDEARRLDDHVGDARVLVVPNGLVVPSRPPDPRPGATDLVLVAGYGYPPNAEAARVLVDEVWPRVRAVRRDVGVTLIGRDLPEIDAQRWRRAGVDVLGVVDNPAPHLARAAALVFLPSWSTGTQLKVAEAIATGLPVVTTPPVARALGLREGEEVLLADDAAEASAQTLRLLGDGALARRLQLAGWEAARARLSREAVAEIVGSGSVLAPLVSR
jgi:glycosyltransferase involved in cell wall biosynthesis